MSDNGPRIARTAKGKKPQYFSDPAIDKLLSMVLTLAEELSVTRERLDALERIIEDEGLLSRDKIDTFTPSPSAAEQRAIERERFIERVLHTVQMQLEEATGDDMPTSEDDILRHLS